MKTVREMVKASLHGFEFRQAARNAKRAVQNERVRKEAEQFRQLARKKGASA